MNPSLNSLKLALRLAVEDADVTAYDITTTLRETMRELSQAHQVRSNKADSVCTGLSLSDTSADFNGLVGGVYGGQNTDTISFSAPQAAQTVPPYFGAGGGDVISFS
tara:strand:- start:740 stop:1060 length:321 start_codon:yes stop_codon:yes gene_type:complete